MCDRNNLSNDLKKLMKTMEGFHIVRSDELKKASAMIGRAFEGYPFLYALFGNPVVSPKKLGEYFRVIIMSTYLNAIAFSLDENINEILFLFPPHAYAMKLSAAFKHGGIKLLTWLTPKIIFSSLKYDDTCLKCKTLHQADDAYYVYIFAVEPSLQGNGRGSMLMKPLVEWAQQTGNSLYLETHKGDNIEMYEHFGFELAGTDIMHTNEPQYAMLFRPRD